MRASSWGVGGLTRAIVGVASLAITTSWPAAPARAATVTIINLDGSNEGFNDPTPVAPVGGNAGTTRGQQRLIVFQTAASIWGSLLNSGVTISVQATFDPLTPCDASFGVLGKAGPTEAAANFTGAGLRDVYYPIALANRQHGSDLDPSLNDIEAHFDSNVDLGTCLGSTSFYYGLDHRHGTDLDLLVVVLHELGHGLGFKSFVNPRPGLSSEAFPTCSRAVCSTAASD